MNYMEEVRLSPNENVLQKIWKFRSRVTLRALCSDNVS